MRKTRLGWMKKNKIGVNEKTRLGWREGWREGEGEDVYYILSGYQIFQQHSNNLKDI
jgi:hypothetical protein